MSISLPPPLSPCPATRIQLHEGSNRCISCPLIHLKKLEGCLAHNKISIRTTCWIMNTVEMCRCQKWWSSTLNRGGDCRSRVWCSPWGSSGRGLEISLPTGRTSTQGGQGRDVRLGRGPPGIHTEKTLSPESIQPGVKWCEYLNPSSEREIQATSLHSEHSAFRAQGYMLL